MISLFGYNSSQYAVYRNTKCLCLCFVRLSSQKHNNVTKIDDNMTIPNITEGCD